MSASRLNRLSRASLAGIALIIMAGLLLSVTLARAETEKGRDIHHTIKIETIKVGDVPNHIVGVAEFKGLVFYDNGEVATVSGVTIFDYINGSGPAQGYELRTFEDGSQQVHKWQGNTTVIQEGEIHLFEGTFSYIQGTGRFAEIKGSGTYSYRGFGEVGGYNDFTGTYTLPEK